MYPRICYRLPHRPEPMFNARFVGRVEQPDPSFFELGIARRRLRAARAWNQRHRPARNVPSRQSLLNRMTRRETYLDWNATALLRPEAAAAMTAALAECGNASSVHRWGRAARQRVERAREQVAELAGAAPDGVVFVSGGTEANHLALLGSGRERVLVSAVEHHSVLHALPTPEPIAVDSNGIVDPGRLDEMLAADPRPALVSVMFANNETGVIQPVAEIARIAHAHGALFHCDAVQAAGKVPLSMDSIGADLLSLSAHKLGGPSGSRAP